MTSEPEGKPGRRPPTIELTATEVDGPGTPPGDEDGPSDKRADSRMKSYAIGGTIGAAAAAAVIGGLWFADVVPSRQAAAPPSPAPPTTGMAENISARLDKIEAAIAVQRQESTQDTAAEAQVKSLDDSLTALSRRLDDIAAAAQTAQKTADAAVAAADGAKSANERNVQRSDLDALSGRIAALESRVKSLANDVAQKSSGTDDSVVRLTLVAEALRGAVERGAPYRVELAAAKSLGAAPSLTAPLEPFAAGGVPNATALARELATLTPAMERASADTSFLGQLKTKVQKLVRITPVDAAAGNDLSAVIARINLDAEHADIAAALTDIAALPDSEKLIAADWVKKAETRSAAIAASRQIAADALAALGKPASQ